MKLGISKHFQGYQVLSQSNKSASIIDEDFRISIYDGEQRKMMDLKKLSTRELAVNELNHFKLLLGIDHFSSD